MRTFSVNDGFETDGSTLVVDFGDIVSKLNEDNYIYNQVQDQWFMFGYQFGDNYLQLGISDKVLLDLTFPKSIFELATLTVWIIVTITPSNDAINT